MIPFTQYKLPRGEKVETGCERPPEIEAKAFAFIESGGKFECEVLSNGMISLTACKIVDGEWQDIAIRLCSNGPGVNDKVDELVNEVMP